MLSDGNSFWSKGVSLDVHNLKKKKRLPWDAIYSFSLSVPFKTTKIRKLVLMALLNHDVMISLLIIYHICRDAHQWYKKNITTVRLANLDFLTAIASNVSIYCYYLYHTLDMVLTLI